MFQKFVTGRLVKNNHIILWPLTFLWWWNAFSLWLIYKWDLYWPQNIMSALLLWVNSSLRTPFVLSSAVYSFYPEVTSCSNHQELLKTCSHFLLNQLLILRQKTPYENPYQWRVVKIQFSSICQRNKGKFDKILLEDL